MVFQHHESCDGLCDQEFHEKGDGEVAWPFVEETGDGFHAHMLASDPCADNGQAYREEEHGTQDVDGPVCWRPGCAGELSGSEPGSIDDLRQDPRVVLSGVSDPRSGLSAAHQVEAYVQPPDLDAVVKDHLLIPAAVPSVFLHVTDHQVNAPVPLGLVLADLADHGGPREDAQVERILKGICVVNRAS